MQLSQGQFLHAKNSYCANNQQWQVACQFGDVHVIRFLIEREEISKVVAHRKNRNHAPTAWRWCQCSRSNVWNHDVLATAALSGVCEMGRILLGLQVKTSRPLFSPRKALSQSISLPWEAPVAPHWISVRPLTASDFFPIISYTSEWPPSRERPASLQSSTASEVSRPHTKASWYPPNPSPFCHGAIDGSAMDA